MIVMLHEEEGQGLVEYGLILVLIAVALVVALSLLGQDLSELFSRVVDAFSV
jgi:pilus assembly protein Flp/PilA